MSGLVWVREPGGVHSPGPRACGFGRVLSTVYDQRAAYTPPGEGSVDAVGFDAEDTGEFFGPDLRPPAR